MSEVKPDMPKLCLVAGCANRTDQGVFVGELCYPCHAMLTTGKAENGATFIHALCAKLAAAEAKVRELEEGDEALLAVLPEDFGAVEYIKHLTAANAALEEKLAEAHAWVSPLDKPMPVMKPMLVALLVHNADTGAKWVEQFACFLHDEDYGLCDLAGRDPLPWEPDSILLYHLLPEPDDAVLEREASRKKGAEHGE